MKGKSKLLTKSIVNYKKLSQKLNWKKIAFRRPNNVSPKLISLKILQKKTNFMIFL